VIARRLEHQVHQRRALRVVQDHHLIVEPAHDRFEQSVFYRLGLRFIEEQLVVAEFFLEVFQKHPTVAGIGAQRLAREQKGLEVLREPRHAPQ
jgi:hypothetical protein